MASLLDGFEDDTTKAYDKKVDVASEKNRRATALVSMTKAEKERLTSRARAYGLSLSVFFRLAVDEYMRSYD